MSGISDPKRSLMAGTTPTIDITFDGSIFKEVIKFKMRDVTMTCNIGEEFTHDVVEIGGSKSVSYSLEKLLDL